MAKELKVPEGRQGQQIDDGPRSYVFEPGEWVEVDDETFQNHKDRDMFVSRLTSDVHEIVEDGNVDEVKEFVDERLASGHDYGTDEEFLEAVKEAEGKQKSRTGVFDYVEEKLEN